MQYGAANEETNKVTFETSPKKRYYPKDKEGNYDEWAALLHNQNETAVKLKKQQDISRRDYVTNEYG